MDAVQINQPRSIYEPPGLGSGPGVRIRNLEDTAADAEFAANLLIEAFRGKFVHNVPENKLPILARFFAARNRNQAPEFYQRIFIAEKEDRTRLGIVELKFKGQTENEPDSSLLSGLGCWPTCRFICFACMTDESISNRTRCYVDHIAVDEKARGLGVGRLLLEAADQEARRRGCTTIYLAVLTTNRARNLYERQGYRNTSRESMCGCLWCCIGDPGEVYIMEKPL